MNQICIAGNLGKAAEVRILHNGDPVAGFTVAEIQGKEKPAIWWNCSLYGKRAESLAPYLLKGQQVTITGSVSEREYVDKDGVKRKAMDVRVQDLALQGGPKRDEGQAQAQSRKPAPGRTEPAKGSGGGFDDMSEDIPFMNPLARRGFHLVV